MVTRTNGWLIVNSFITSHKFEDLYQLLNNAAEKYSINIQLVKAADLLLSIPSLKGKVPDFAIFWDKDIVLAKTLELLKVRLFNTAHAIEICDNKALTSIYLQNAGIKIPETYFFPMTFSNLPYENCDFALKAAEQIGYPLVLKENYGSFGEQVYLVKDKVSLLNTILSLESKGFILQEYIVGAAGHDIRVSVVGGKVVAAMHRYSVTGDFRSNLTLGGESEPIEVADLERKLAIDACHAIGLDFAGVDIMRDSKSSYICEVNSNPHFRTTLNCTGVNMAEEIMLHIKDELCL